jgi:hypothetical protein
MGGIGRAALELALGRLLCRLLAMEPAGRLALRDQGLAARLARGVKHNCIGQVTEKQAVRRWRKPRRCASVLPASDDPRLLQWPGV